MKFAEAKERMEANLEEGRVSFTTGPTFPWPPYNSQSTLRTMRPLSELPTARGRLALISSRITRIIPKYNDNGTMKMLENPTYTNFYNVIMGRPQFVLEMLTSEMADLATKRVDWKKKRKFIQDLRIHKKKQLQESDVRKSHLFTRGHLATASNHKCSKEAYKATFLLTNIIVEIKNEIWSEIEKKIRDLAADFREVYVVTKPIYEESAQQDLHVPTHLLKVAICKERAQYADQDLGRRMDVYTEAYLVPNESLTECRPTYLEKFRISTIQEMNELVGDGIGIVSLYFSRRRQDSSFRQEPAPTLVQLALVKKV